MSTTVRVAIKEAATATASDSLMPVPAPPKTRLKSPGIVEQASFSARRQHQMQQVIRDLAALAAGRCPRVS
jgi:hypothetical protein